MNMVLEMLNKRRGVSLALLLLYATIFEAVACGLLFVLTLRTTNGAQSAINFENGRSVLVEIFAILIAVTTLFASARLAFGWGNMLTSARLFVLALAVPIAFLIAVVA